jgi:hypothetical protein
MLPRRRVKAPMKPVEPRKKSTKILAGMMVFDPGWRLSL